MVARAQKERELVTTASDVSRARVFVKPGVSVAAGEARTKGWSGAAARRDDAERGRAEQSSDEALRQRGETGAPRAAVASCTAAATVMTAQHGAAQQLLQLVLCRRRTSVGGRPVLVPFFRRNPTSSEAGFGPIKAGNGMDGGEERSARGRQSEEAGRRRAWTTVHGGSRVGKPPASHGWRWGAMAAARAARVSMLLEEARRGEAS